MITAVMILVQTDIRFIFMGIYFWVDLVTFHQDLKGFISSDPSCRSYQVFSGLFQDVGHNPERDVTQI